jgi:hypothetical protein
MAYPQYGWQTGPATVTTPGSVLNFRPGGGLNYAPFGSIPHGGSVNITGPSTASGGYNWYPVTYGGKTGWVAGQYLTGMPGSAPTTTPTPTPTPSPSPQPMPGLGDIANTVGQYPQNNQQPTGSPYYQAVVLQPGQQLRRGPGLGIDSPHGRADRLPGDQPPGGVHPFLLPVGQRR